MSRSATSDIVTPASNNPIKPPLERTMPPLSILRRFFYAFGYTVFGLIFFYLLMVTQSAMSKQIILARVPYNSWTRIASRQTGANCTFPLLFFQLSNKRTLSSLFWSIMLASALFAHSVIISSDGHVFADTELMDHIRTKEHFHPLFSILPIVVWRAAGSLGFFAAWILTIERTYGPALRRRSPQLPAVCNIAVRYLVAVLTFYYVDRLVALYWLPEPTLADVIYPIFFLLSLFVGSTYRATQSKVDALAQSQDAKRIGKKDL